MVCHFRSFKLFYLSISYHRTSILSSKTLDIM
uniref:Uncharacterized protein n=1 Tax=Klebsiella phage vB_KpnM_Iguana_ER37 TaxID=3076781 RepID=A0AB38Z4F3_9CAUD|nr:MAG TPA: hypothetical protein [Caudoviricetes sp.]